MNMDEIDELVEMMEEFLKKDKLFEMGAKMIKKSVDAMEKAGFTRKEAIQIIAVQGSIVKGNR
jgi:hypothetical protein